MVPVRKPGRPLSVCPHPSGQGCTCNNTYITAAIPRKQACRCGDAHTPPPASPLTADANPIGAEAPSPTKVTFKVEKISRQRKQSFDPAKLERMDMNHVNVIPFDQRSQMISSPLTNGYAMMVPQQYGYAPQYSSIHTQYTHIPFQPPQQPSPGMLRTNGMTNGMTNGSVPHYELPLATESTLVNGGSEKPVGGSCCNPKQPAQVELPPKSASITAENRTNGSCCGPKQNGHSQSSSASSFSESQDHRAGSSSSAERSNRESISSMGTPGNMTPQMSHQMSLQFGMDFNTALYSQYNQATVFTYPPTYGSFQNPLQPGSWLQSVQNNSYTASQAPGSIPPAAFATPLVPETLDTVHTCSCGDGCSCVGCAAHPYNKQTQDYVRSAYSYEHSPQPLTELQNNGQHMSNGNGSGNIQPQGIDPVSPTANTPSSSTSGQNEEQTLSEADFFFVNYPFSELGCGGDEQSCPCGDDCQCLGCDIHHAGRIMEATAGVV